MGEAVGLYGVWTEVRVQGIIQYLSFFLVIAEDKRAAEKYVRRFLEKYWKKWGDVEMRDVTVEKFLEAEFYREGVVFVAEDSGSAYCNSYREGRP